MNMSIIQNKNADHYSRHSVLVMFSKTIIVLEKNNVGMTRFELATTRPPDVCATGLRYIPK